MSALRKYALFQLSVVVAAAVAVAILFAWSHNVLASLAGFSVLATLALGGLFARGGGGEAIHDERDHQIQRQAALAGYTALWLAFVAWGVAVPLKFGSEGLVPLVWVAPVVWVAGWLVVLVRSITILVLDSRGV